MLREHPAASLRLLNQALCADAPEPTFCTVFDARVRPRDGGLDLRFSNGGHPAPLLLRSDGAVDAIESGRGPIVGAFPVERFGEDSLRLERGDLLLLYTDGVTEVRPTDVEFGERELRATVAALAGASPEEVVAAVSERALALQSGEQRDDIALVAIRAREEGAPAVS
jgi:phosphoserine phosphatase RsbU/P